MKRIVIDIETAPICELTELSGNLLNIWNKKFKTRFEGLSELEKYESNASFFTLFSKIICISVSATDNDVIKSYIGEEKTILENFSKDLIKLKNSGETQVIFIGQNIKRFDVPFILQKAISYNIDMPFMKKSIGCKPWESPIIDTMELFQISSSEWYSLDYICNMLNIPTPKTNMDGSQVWGEFKKGNIDKIARYCEADVIATKQVYIKFINYLNL